MSCCGGGHNHSSNDKHSKKDSLMASIWPWIIGFVVIGGLIYFID
ncbi:hypothetical protein ACTQ5K_20540 [Niallia sp. Sow4_A1]|uniref:Uncharacterized protein n=1 Tax=Niallia hominis TaxID=3133173 RepID=A0ABV1F150_9BACI|nr:MULTISPECIES: hypothetical protein [Bacillaceae]